MDQPKKYCEEFKNMYVKIKLCIKKIVAIKVCSLIKKIMGNLFKNVMNKKNKN